jgi:hypothetical protein
MASIIHTLDRFVSFVIALSQVQQSVLVIEGLSNAIDMAAAEIRQTIATGRANWGVPQPPIPPGPYAGATAVCHPCPAPAICSSINCSSSGSSGSQAAADYLFDHIDSIVSMLWPSIRCAHRMQRRTLA